MNRLPPLRRAARAALRLLAAAALAAAPGPARGQSPEYFLREGVRTFKRASFPEALEFFHAGLRQARKDGDRRSEGIFLSRIGDVRRALGEHMPALSYYEPALEILRERRDTAAEAAVLAGMGAVHLGMGDHRRALRRYEEALAIHRRDGHRAAEGAVTGEIGGVLAEMEDFEAAIDSFKRALAALRDTGGRRDEIRVLLADAGVRRRLGDYEKALVGTAEARSAARKIVDRAAETDVLSAVAALHADLGAYEEAAEALRQALAINEPLGRLDAAAGIREALGDTARAAGDRTAAADHYRAALAIRTRTSAATDPVELKLGEVLLEEGKTEEAFAIFSAIGSPLHLGRYHLGAKRYAAARREFSSLLAALDRRALPPAAELFAACTGLGLACEAEGDLPAARRFFARAAAVVERQRGGLAAGRRERFFAARTHGFPRLEPYYGMIRVILREGGPDAAERSLEFAERIGSRTFVEMLALRDAGAFPPRDRAVLEADRRLSAEIRVLRRYLDRLAELGGKAPGGERERAAGDLAAAEARYDAFIRETRLASPELASLISPLPVSEERLRAALGDSAALVEYLPADDRTWVWTVLRERVAVAVLPVGTAELEKKIAGLLASCTRPGRADAAPRAAARELYDLLLRPVLGAVGARRLTVVPYGPLGRIPFAALDDGAGPLGERRAVAVLPAGGVLEFLARKGSAGKASAAVFADPAVGRQPLACAREEGTAVARLFPKAVLYEGARATETAARALAPACDVVHLATHGEFNPRRPWQSGLLFARDARNDGYLQVHEIFGLDLARSNLVTLSACDTARSGADAGEDLAGMTRGFIYAGAPAVLASLWEVDDRSTRILMEEFYREWRAGRSRGEALRRAQSFVRSIPKYRHPYYWASFTLVGDPR